MSRNPREILDAAAGTRVPEEVNLYPRIAAKIEKKSLMHTLRAKPALLVFVVLLALTLVSSVVYAVGHSLGYIPGVGIVEQGAPLRVLAEPVSVTRDGITLSVQQALLASDKTILTYTLEGVSWNMQSHQEDVPGCYAQGQLRLPDGTMSESQSGSGGQDASGRWETRMVYAPIPAEVNEADFLLECIQNTLPGKAPENWSLPLRFIPSPADLTIAPVVEVPSPTPASGSETVLTDGLILEKVIETEDGYILIGIFRSGSLPYGAQAMGFSDWPKVTDANGNELDYMTPGDVDISSSIIGEFPWAVEIKGKEQAWPLTLSLPAVVAEAFNLAADFTFDTGQDPQPGQVWELAQDVQLGDFTVRVERARFTGNGYQFEMSTSPDVHAVALDIRGTTPLSGGGGGDGQGHLDASVDFEKAPTGLLTVRLSAPTFTVRKTWRLQWAPDFAAQSESLYGLQLFLDEFIPLEDGYYLIGHTEWTDERLVEAAPAGWDLKAYDATGRELAIQPAVLDEDSAVAEGLAPGQWAYRLFGKAFEGPVTLRTSQMGITYKNPVRLTLDLSSFGFEFADAKLGLPYKTGLIPVDVPALSARLARVTYIKEGDLRGLELAFDADPRLLGLGFVIESGLDTSGLLSLASADGSYRDPQRDFMVARVLSNARMSFPLVFAAQAASVKGDWSVEWDPPAAESSHAPFYAPQACVTLETFKQAVNNPPSIPSGLPPKILLSRSALAPAASMFLVDLYSKDEIPLTFEQGSLSPDGMKFVYVDQENRITVLDIASGQKTSLGEGFSSPLWSPDGSRIAFLRLGPNGPNIFVMDADGGNLHALMEITESPTLLSWTPDGSQVVYAIGSRILTADASGGEAFTLVETSLPFYENSVSFSQEGWTVHLESVPGRMAPGLLISRMDGSDMRLLVQLDHWIVISPVFSPEGEWLAISVINTDLPDTPITPALLNINTCQVVPLTTLNGEIRGWVK